MTSRVAIRLANAPYACGPRSRAAAMVKPYVATFMIPIATAIDPAPLSSRVRRRGGEATGRSLSGRIRMDSVPWTRAGPGKSNGARP
jgi:hypothetical protein